MFTTVTKGETKRLRWVPDELIATIAEANGVVYIYETLRGQIAAIGYKGACGRAEFHFSYSSVEAARRKAAEFLAGVAEWNLRRQRYREERSTLNEIKVGEIVVNSWGYEQTNVDWYVVVRSSAHSVWLQPIASELTPDTGFAPMSGMVVPSINVNGPDPEKWGTTPIQGAVEKHKATGRNVIFKYGGGRVWDGSPRYCSWYA